MVRKKTQNTERNAGIGLGGVIIAILVIWLLFGGHHSNSDNQNRGETNNEVQFCNNTYFLAEDEQGNHVNGTIYLSSNNGDRFEKVNFGDMPITKLQVGLPYVYWIDSKDYFVFPTTFQVKCINEADTTPDYIPIKAYKKGQAMIVGFDELSTLGLDSSDHANISWQEFPENSNYGNIMAYRAVVRIEYIETPRKWFMPFGGDLILEYPNRFDVQCTSDEDIILLQNSHYLFVINKVSDIYRDYGLHGIDTGQGMEHIITCEFRTHEKVSDGELRLEFHPSNFYLTNIQQLKLDISKADNEEPWILVENMSIIKSYKFDN